MIVKPGRFFQTLFFTSARLPASTIIYLTEFAHTMSRKDRFTLVIPYPEAPPLLLVTMLDQGDGYIDRAIARLYPCPAKRAASSSVNFDPVKRPAVGKSCDFPIHHPSYSPNAAIISMITGPGSDVTAAPHAWTF